MGNDMIRMSGMNSGLDTESIINALTANTKLKATKQERNVLKYEATQEAYRDIISKMQNIKNKYFDILNKDSYLSGTSIWNKYASKVYDSANVETLASGISVSTTVNSNPGDYKVAVNKTAKQAKLTGKSISSSAKVDVGSLTGDPTKEFGMTVTVGDVTKTITFRGGSSEKDTRDNMNKALEEAFGESNESVNNDESNADRFKGMVYVDNDGQIVSRAGKGITMSGVGKMNDTSVLDLSNVKTGTNTVSFQIGDQTISTSFQTIESTYFDKAIGAGVINTATGEVNNDVDISTYADNLARTELGADASDSEVNQRSFEIQTEISNSAALYSQILDDYKESVRYDSFTAWRETATDDQLNALYEDAVSEKLDSSVSGWIAKNEEMNAAYEQYKTDYTGDPDEMKSAYQYFSDLRTEGTISEAFSNKLTLLEHKFEGLGNGETDYDDAYYNTEYAKYKDNYATKNLSDDAKAAYETYKAGLGEDETALSIYEWATSGEEGLGNESAKAELTAAQAENPMKTFEEVKADKIEENNWKPNKTKWLNNESNVFSEYKKLVYNESEATYDTSKRNAIDHFNETTFKNSIGKLSVTTADGKEVKLDVTYNRGDNAASGDADGNSVTVKAYTESNGERTPVNVSMTIGTGSANSASVFGSDTSDVSTSISQITNSTKLSDVGATADENGNYNFTINGKSFSFDGNTTVNDMMKKINASSAGVKMTYSSLDNAFTVTSTAYGLSSEVTVEDTNGGNLLSKLGIAGGDYTAGENLEVYINGKLYQSETNSIEVDGSTFTISNKAQEPAEGEEPTEFTVSIGKDTTAIKDLIKDFVKDYNQLIEDVYKYLDEKPEKDYYFLTDADKEDLDLTEKQEEKWEEKSKKGLLYHDSITSTIMTNLRTALMGSVEGLDGNTFSLSSMGLKTVTDYNKHGMFAAVDEDALDRAIDNNLDDIQKLFSDSENGIMKKFSSALDLGIGTTGTDKGTLIRKAGLASGSTAKDNEIFNAIKRTKTKVASLNKRYENEQNRLWKKYSNMESLLGTMNSQQASFMSYFQQ